MFRKENDKLIYRYDAEKLWIEPWGENALRIRATKDNIMPPEDWAFGSVSCVTRHRMSYWR